MSLARGLRGLCKSTESSSTEEPKSVFAHFILGVAAGYTKRDWVLDVSEAQAAGIDAFILNIGATDPCNSTQLEYAYSVAEELGFRVAISFDYLAPGPWEASSVLSILQQFTRRAAQFKYNGLPLVSAFEGASNVKDWIDIQSAIPIYFIPSWTSLGPYSPAFQIAHGAFSWDAWPLGAQDKHEEPDRAWLLGMGDKAYMMGVSPWFYTNLPRYQKNWVWRGDDLWYDRWQQVKALQPKFVQIISWNDYGESHYIGPIHDTGIPGSTPQDPKGAHRYVDGMPHDRWRDLLPYYIEAYKTNSDPATDSDKLHFWYRLSSTAAGSIDNTVGNAPWEPFTEVHTVVQDRVFFTGLLKAPAVITLRIGDYPADRFSVEDAGIFHSSSPFNGRTGVVFFQIMRNYVVVASGTGERIVGNPVDGNTNFNAWVGGVDEVGS